MITAATPEDIYLFGRLIQYRPTEGAKGIKLVKDGTIRAMTAYDSWTPNSVQMHIYVEDRKAFSRAFIRECFVYPFIQARRKIAIAVIPADNEESIDFAKRIGFIEQYRIIDGWEDGVDLVLHELDVDTCIWLPGRGTFRRAGARGPTSHSQRMANG